MTAAADHITDALDRAQYYWNLMLAPGQVDMFGVNLFVHYVTTAVLLEHLRRFDPDLADRLVPWLMGVDGGIFADGYAGELLHQWRTQLAAGEQLSPIVP